MKTAELRSLSVADLQRREEDLRQELFQLRMQKATDQLTNTARLKRAKRDLARVLTILGEVAHG